MRHPRSRDRYLRSLLLLVLASCETTWIDPMEEQKKYKPYRENPMFPDGRAMRPLVEGTVAREQPIGGSILLEGQDEGTFTDKVPLPVTRDLLLLGKKRYEITCAPCHGLLGDGDSVVARRMLLRPPPSLIAPPVSTYPAGRIFHSISLGYGLMAPYAAEVPFVERWATVAYLSALRLSQDAPIDSAPALDRQRLQGEPR